MELKKIIVLLICIALGITIYLIGNKKNTEIKIEETKQFLDVFMTEKVEEEPANIDYYTVYGENLNIKGSLSINTDNVSDVSLIMINSDIEKEFNLFYSKDIDKINFSTYEKINEGLVLDNLELGNYILALKVAYNNVEDTSDDILDKYYLLVNNTGYSDLDYYTVTRDKANKLVSIKFKTYEEKSFVVLDITDNPNMDNIYDIVIDPGHGGKDSGAINGNYYESNVALDCAKILKEKLESNGFKVKLTRENSSDTVNTYDAGGRVALAYETKAKYTFSIHLNSSTVKTVGGIEVYAPNNSNLTLAKNLADSLAKLTSFGYSKNKSYKVENGVYVKNFDNYLKKEIVEIAEKHGFQPYQVDSDTPYLYMIRETGGISTHAYVDGRDTRYSINKYYKSNIGTESYLIEIGYLSNDDELNNIINNQEKYASALAESITNYIKDKKID